MKILLPLLAFCLSFNLIYVEEIRNFRAFSEVIDNPHLNHEGVEGKCMSGSGQLSLKAFQELASKVKEMAGDSIDKILLIDLRLEPHGYLNGLPISWKTSENFGKATDEILLDEEKRLQELFRLGDLDGYPIQSVASEQEIGSAEGFVYVRLPTLDHSYPDDEIVDAFIQLIKDHPSSWLHLHCAVGKGRTTLFMAMYDMFYNAPNVSFQDILKRLKEIGGQDFKKCLTNPNGNAKKQNLFLNRLAFLEQFYEFCCNENAKDITWQDWQNMKKI